MRASVLLFLTLFMILAEAAVIPVFWPGTSETMAYVAALAYPGLLFSALLTQTWHTRL